MVRILEIGYQIPFHLYTLRVEPLPAAGRRKVSTIVPTATEDAAVLAIKELGEVGAGNVAQA